jgi:hypothetical protein
MASFNGLMDFVKYAPSRLRIFAQHIYTCMNGNPYFPKPPISMKALSTQIDTFGALIAEGLDGSRKVIAQRNSQGFVLVGMLKQLLGYVEYIADEDEAAFTSSGFNFVSTKRKQAATKNQAIRKVVLGDISGQLKVKVVSQNGASSYELRYAIRPIDRSPSPDEWTTKRLSDTRKFLIINGLKPATVYLLQVRALIGEEFTDWSDAVTQICT